MGGIDSVLRLSVHAIKTGRGCIRLYVDYVSLVVSKLLSGICKGIPHILREETTAKRSLPYFEKQSHMTPNMLHTIWQRLAQTLTGPTTVYAPIYTFIR